MRLELMENMKEIIYKRKSTRKYDMTSLDDTIFEDIWKFWADDVKPLYNIKVDYKITESEKIKGLFAVKAPHYLTISSEVKDGYLTNVGFMFQQMDLYLQNIGLGSCWLGSAKPLVKPEPPLEFVIMLAFGKPLERPYRNLSEFKRKPLNEISDASDKRLEAARLAPSGINSQPWYFVNDGNIFHVYCEKHGAVKALIYERMNKIDMGIALAHLYVGNKDTFRFFTVENPKQMKGYYYIGSVEI
jgi:nitroreductase